MMKRKITTAAGEVIEVTFSEELYNRFKNYIEDVVTAAEFFPWADICLVALEDGEVLARAKKKLRIDDDETAQALAEEAYTYFEAIENKGAQHV